MAHVEIARWVPTAREERWRVVFLCRRRSCTHAGSDERSHPHEVVRRVDEGEDPADSLATPMMEFARPYKGVVVKENLLPTPLPALSVTVQAMVRARYDCVKGAL